MYADFEKLAERLNGSHLKMARATPPLAYRISWRS